MVSKTSIFVFFLAIMVSILLSNEYGLAGEPSTQRSSDSSIAGVVTLAREWDRGAGLFPNDNIAKKLFEEAATSTDGEVLVAAYLVGISSRYQHPDVDDWLYRAADSGNIDAKSIVILRAALLQPKDIRAKWVEERIEAIENTQVESARPSSGPPLAFAQALTTLTLDKEGIALLERLGTLAIQRQHVSGIGVVAIARIYAGDTAGAVEWLRKGVERSDPLSRVILAQLAIEHPTIIQVPEPQILKLLDSVVADGKATRRTYELISRCYSAGIGSPRNAKLAEEFAAEAQRQKAFEERPINLARCNWLRL